MTSYIVSGSAPAASRLLPIDRLRAFITTLVVVHHAVLAYHPYAPKPPAALASDNMIWGAFPIVDGARWPGADLFVGFNDSYFMALMFLLAGLFVPAGLVRRGAGDYLGERSLRLGVPFLIGAAVLAPLAYAAAYAQITPTATPAGFASQWLALGVWPAGPAWFLWVLFAFAAFAALLQVAVPGWAASLARVLFGDGQRPWRALLGLVGASALVYLPTAALIDPTWWSSAGPFFVQTARVPLYLLYFLAGAALSTLDAERGLLAADGKLARRWVLWTQTAPMAFLLLVALFLVLLSVLQKGGDAGALKALVNFAFVLSCATTSFAMLSVFLRKARAPGRIWDSLSRNAFGIYVLHYPIVAWLQYALLDAPLRGYAKGCIVIAVGLGASWLATGMLRRIPWVERVIGRGGPLVPAGTAPAALAMGRAS